MFGAIDDITHPCDEGHEWIDQGCFTVCARCGRESEPDLEAIVEAQRQDPDPDFHNSNFYDITSRR